MRSYKKLSVGIKELKDRASEIVALVHGTGQIVSITRNQQEVARIMPVPADAHERLMLLASSNLDLSHAFFLI